MDGVHRQSEKLGFGVRRSVVVLGFFDGIDFALEAADCLTQSFPDLGQFSHPEQHHQDDQDDDEFW